MKTYKDLVVRAQAILTEYLSTPVTAGQPTCPQQHAALGKLVELFDGPEQREVERLEAERATPAAMFKAGWDAFAEQTYLINVEKGFFAPGRAVIPADQLLLIVCEICEGYEHHRKGRNDDKLVHRSGLEVEIADAVIRSMNYGKHLGFDLPTAILEKTQFNSSRPYLHGDTYKAESQTPNAATPKDADKEPFTADWKRDGHKLRTMTVAESRVILARYAHATVEAGFFYDEESQSWQPMAEFWEPANPAAIPQQDRNFTGAEN